MTTRTVFLAALCVAALTPATAHAETTGAPTTGPASGSAIRISAPADGGIVGPQFDVAVDLIAAPSAPISDVALAVDGEPLDEQCPVEQTTCMYALMLDPGYHQIEASAVASGQPISDVIGVTVESEEPDNDTENSETADAGTSGDTDDPDQVEESSKGCSIGDRSPLLPCLALLVVWGIRRRR